MTTIPHIRQAIQNVLGPIARQIGWETGFQQRQSKLDGSRFVQSLVFSSLGNKSVSYTHLTTSALDAGVQITPQGIAQRFSPASARLCQKVLEASVQQVLTSDPHWMPLLARFTGIYIRDSSVITLPAELHPVWPGVGGTSGESSALKLQVRLEYSSGQLAGPMLQAGRAHDSRSPYQTEALPAGAVRMGDLGFFGLSQFLKDQQQGVYTFSRYKLGTRLYERDGQPIDLLAWLQRQTAAQCECRVYRVVIVHWIFQIDGWRTPLSSFWKAALAVRHFATAMAIALPDPAQVEKVLTLIQSQLRSHCRMNPRRSHPSTQKRLLALSSALDRTLA